MSRKNSDPRQSTKRTRHCSVRYASPKETFEFSYRVQHQAACSGVSSHGMAELVKGCGIIWFWLTLDNTTASLRALDLVAIRLDGLHHKRRDYTEARTTRHSSLCENCWHRISVIHIKMCQYLQPIVQAHVKHSPESLSKYTLVTKMKQSEFFLKWNSFAPRWSFGDPRAARGSVPYQPWLVARRYQRFRKSEKYFAVRLKNTLMNTLWRTEIDWGEVACAWRIESVCTELGDECWNIFPHRVLLESVVFEYESRWNIVHWRLF